MDGLLQPRNLFAASILLLLTAIMVLWCAKDRSKRLCGWSLFAAGSALTLFAAFIGLLFLVAGCYGPNLYCPAKPGSPRPTALDLMPLSRPP
ncbi:MAG TPA: hypothetical protein VL358_06650 [Caulobacteraceae bacterium]|jgi:hypothetical protein|nr:hypothetical protein [Caulobacteraceae bacterium]